MNQLFVTLVKRGVHEQTEYLYTKVLHRDVWEARGFGDFPNWHAMFGLLVLCCFEEFLKLHDPELQQCDESLLERERNINPDLLESGYTLENFQRFAWKYGFLPAGSARSAFDLARHMRSLRKMEPGESVELFW